MRKLLILVVLTIWFASALDAQTTADERAAYDAELKELKANPAKLAETRGMFTLVAQMLLGRLGYGIPSFNATLDEPTRKALREYEKRRGVPITGDPMSFDTLTQIQKDMEAIDYHPASLPSFFAYVTDWNDGYFMAKGTWVLTGERMAWPEQAVEFKCYRETATCLETTATIMRTGGTPSLSVESEWYDIERWDGSEIVTKPKDYGCTRYVKRVNRVQKSVTGVRSTISDTTTCKALDAQDKFMVLSDGIKVYIDLLAEKRTSTEGLLLIPSEAKKVLLSSK